MDINELEESKEIEKIKDDPKVQTALKQCANLKAGVLQADGNYLNKRKSKISSDQLLKNFEREIIKFILLSPCSFMLLSFSTFSFPSA